MIQKGLITYPEFTKDAEQSKIDFFKKIKTSELDAMSIIFKDTSPTVVQQAALFIHKLSKPGYKTAIPGVIRAEHYVMTSYEYIKKGSNWIIYLNFEVDKKQGIEFTKLNPRIRFAIAKINNINYLAYEGADKVFVIENAFSGAFGVINVDELNDFMDKREDKDPYRLSNIDEEAFLADAPEQLFGDDTVFYRDSENFGFWISFGTLVKVDNIDFNNINIDGVPVALIDKDLDEETQFRHMLNAKAAGYACVLFSKEAMLRYLLKEAKQYILTYKKQDFNKVCLEDLLKNVSEKGILGIVYEKVQSINEMYLPAFDYTTAKVKDIVGEAIAFIYDDEYIWMHYDRDNKELALLSYKGDVLEFGDRNISFTIYPEPALSKINKVNDENFILFTGFKNLEVNNVLDIYFDGRTQILESKNDSFAIDVEAFDDYYKDATSSFNATFNKTNEAFKIFGNNKYALITGLLHYKEYSSILDRLQYKADVQTRGLFASVVDAVEKKVYLNAPAFLNYAYLSQGGFKAPDKNFSIFVKEYIDKYFEKSSIDMFYGVVVSEYFSNGYITIKDKDRYITLKTDTDKYRDFAMFDMRQEIEERLDEILDLIPSNQRPNSSLIADELRALYNIRYNSVEYAQRYSLVAEVANKIKVCSEKERWVFEKVSDNMYVNNKPVNEICNHAILFEDAIQRAIKDAIEEPEGDFASPYIGAARLKALEDKYVLEVKADLSEKQSIFYAPDLGLIFANIIKDPDIPFMKLKPAVIMKYNGSKEVNGESYDFFNIRYGFRIEMDFESAEAEAQKEISQAYNSEISQAKDIVAYASADMKRGIENSDDEYVKRAFSDSNEATQKLKNGIDESFIEAGLSVTVAYQNGKIMVSIGSDDLYEPYESDNGLRLNYHAYISDAEVFERELRNMMLSNLHEVEYSGYRTNRHIVNPQQLKIERIMLNKDLTIAAIECYTQDIPVVINGLLYQPGEKILYTLDVDVDVDYINQNTSNRIVFIDLPVEYKTIYPIDTKREVNYPEDITEDENCFDVIHHIPLTLKLPGEGYVYEKKSDAINDGALMFVNFTKKDDK